jgi:two-component system, OmpR family, sensor histidine kinase BaeS
MKFSLSLKIFITFFTVTVTSSLLIVMAARVSNNYFEKYVQMKEMKKLEYLAKAASGFYSENKGWELFIKNPDLWRAWISSGSSKVDVVSPSQEGRPPLEPTITMRPLSLDREQPMPIWDPVNLGPRLALFSAKKERVAGAQEAVINEYDVLPVETENVTVGWIGLKRIIKRSDALDQEYQQKQIMIIIITGGIILLFSSFFALIFSRHLLKPIRFLADATRALTQRNFGVRVKVQSSDELGNLAERFNFMAKKMEDYEQNQLRWLSDISHELRTPLSVLIGEIEAIQDGVRKADEKALRSLSDEAKHLEKLVNDLHVLSLAESGAISMKMMSLKPVSILSQAIYHFNTRIENSGMSVEVHIEPNGDELEMPGDPLRLMQLFSNIIENALIHTEKPGRLIVKEIHTYDTITFTFEDSGPGVQQESLPRLFERLYRADSSRSRATGGSGLGLAICKSIVELHHGKIQALSSSEGGLKIEITFPIKQINEL